MHDGPRTERKRTISESESTGASHTSAAVPVKRIKPQDAGELIFLHHLFHCTHLNVLLVISAAVSTPSQTQRKRTSPGSGTSGTGPAKRIKQDAGELNLYIVSFH